MDARKRGLSVPLYHIVARPLCRTLLSDAPKHVAGNLCLETDQHWWYDLSEEELAHFCGSSKHFQSQDDVSIKALKLHGMVMFVCMLVVVYGERPPRDRKCVLVRSDSEALAHTGCGVVGRVRSPGRGLSYA